MAAIIRLESNIREVTRGLSDVQKKQIPFTTYRTVNTLAFETMRHERDQIPRYMETPTPFTVRSVRVQRAPNKRAPVAFVYITEAAEEYVERLVEGGVEMPKRTALVQPVSTQRQYRNRFGNIPNKAVQRMKGKPSRYFFGVPKGRHGQQYAGIWERYGRGGRHIRQVIHFHRGGRTVRKSFPFYDIAKWYAADRAADIFVKELGRALGLPGSTVVAVRPLQ